MAWNQPVRLAEAGDFHDTVGGQKNTVRLEMAVEQASRMGGVQALRCLAEQSEPDATHRSQRGPIAAGQSAEPFLEDCGPALDIEHFPSGSQVGVRNFAGRREPG